MSNLDILEIDFNDLEQIKQVCKKYCDTILPFCGKNVDGEHVIISVFEDKVVVSTLQKNGWTRTNIYYTDGVVEETYKK